MVLRVFALIATSFFPAPRRTAFLNMNSSDSQRQKLTVLAVVLAAYVMIVLDISIVITALPKIQRSLDFSPTNLSWVQNAYTLAFGGLLLFGARCGDIFGRRRTLVVGLVIFSLASVFIGAAVSPAMIVIARAIQGLGAAVLAPSTLALLSVTFKEGHERTKALSLYGATAGVSASVGLVLGGVIADWFSWRIGFFINVPIGAALIYAALKYLPETERHDGKLDIAGALLSTTGMSLLVFAIVRSATSGFNDAITLGAYAAALLLLIGFVITESVVSQPILPLRIFASGERSIAYLSRTLFVGGAVGFFFFSTQYMQVGLRLSPFWAGVGFLPATLSNFAAASRLPKLTARFGHKAVLVIALAISVVAMIWLSFVRVAGGYWIAVALPMLLVGAGQGMALGPLTIAGVSGVASKDAGAASGMVNVAHQLGGSLGLGILIVVFHSAGGAVGGGSQQFAEKIGTTFMGMAILTFGALLLVVGKLMFERLQSRQADVQSVLD
jgi:EmrB/QacA subfamily drug resistance transporter